MRLSEIKRLADEKRVREEFESRRRLICLFMRLSEIKRLADEKKVKEVSRIRNERQLQDLDVHPLLKWGCERNIRDAYFFGIVFAALTDDLKIDEQEKKCISRIGHSLSLAVQEQDKAIEFVERTVTGAVQAGGDGVFSLLDDSAHEFADERVQRLFVAEYFKVCGGKEFDAEDVKEQLLEHVLSQHGVPCPNGLFDALSRFAARQFILSPSDLQTLCIWYSADVVRYLMLDIRGYDVASELLLSDREGRNEIDESNYESLEEYYAALSESKAFEAESYDYSDVLESRC